MIFGSLTPNRLTSFTVMECISITFTIIPIAGLHTYNAKSESQGHAVFHTLWSRGVLGAWACPARVTHHVHVQSCSDCNGGPFLCEADSGWSSLGPNSQHQVLVPILVEQLQK